MAVAIEGGLVRWVPIHVVVQVDQILRKHRLICRDPPMSALPDGQTGKQACPARGCIG